MDDFTSQPIELSAMTDEKVVFIAKSNGPYSEVALEYLMNKYKSLVKSRARGYFLIGADSEDIIQEGMIGLYKAVRDYNEEKSVSFRAFAEICTTRQIITAIKASTRQKHIPLNSYISLNKPLYDDESDYTISDTICTGNLFDPEKIVIDKESVSKMKHDMNKVLSKFEMQVLSLYLDGDSYQQIAVRLNKPVKSIDNALQRIKKKLITIL